MKFLARFWSASTSFRRSARSVRKISFDMTLISIDQRIYWRKISIVLINIDWLINFYTSQYSVFVLRSAFIKLSFWHDSHKNIDQVEDFFPCVAALSTKYMTSRLFASMFICLSVCVTSIKFCFASLSLHILQLTTNFWRFVCLSACLRHQSKICHYSCNWNSAEENVLFCKFQFTYFAINIQISDTSPNLRQEKIQNRQCIRSFQRWMQHFWYF